MCVCETNTTRQFCNRRGEICFAGLEPTKASASMREPLIHIKCLVVMWLPKLWRGMYVAMRCPPVSHGITRGGVPSKLSQIAHFDGWYEWVTCTATPSANTGEAMLRLWFLHASLSDRMCVMSTSTYHQCLVLPTTTQKYCTGNGKWIKLLPRREWLLIISVSVSEKLQHVWRLHFYSCINYTSPIIRVTWAISLISACLKFTVSSVVEIKWHLFWALSIM